ncbi:LacI family DNA-binding transcriptional regulator [Microlunatus flavus]|uniref:LacI family transcriptional regulator n=1 Tax=Microlunatus flavus TaxID=1036181 RepID=A0A1H9HP65_9ACTN|nr:LacI family DNA-binding transcriptional regulator [Microlunatus flavus]SEQ64103.1 LacI family transcriptional regulator [Microlunatus flavus]
MTKHGQPTLGAVAAEAGVSLATVSKVLNDRVDVSAGTRARVRRLLDAHGYVPTVHRNARGRWLVSLVLPALDSPYALEILRGVTASPLDVVVCSLSDGAGPTSWTDQVLGSGRAGALVVVPELTDPERTRLAGARTPCVVIDPTGPLDGVLPSVGATNRAGGLAATRHLLDLGHRRIAVIGGPRQVLCSRARIEGYRAALESRGLAVDPDLVRPGDFHHAGGFAQTQALLRLPDPPTAVFAGSDEQALGVVDAARHAGLRVPDDLSVVGFDDLPVARWSSPPLTTVRQPLAEMGRTAAEMLLALLEGEQLARRPVELATSLCVRSSTAPPSDGGVGQVRARVAVA